MTSPEEPGPELRSSLFDRQSERRLIGGLLAMVLAILVLSALWVSEQALTVFDDLLLPEFDRDAEIIAERIAFEIERADRLGIELTELRGVESYLGEYLEEHPALVYLAVEDRAGILVEAVGPAAEALPVLETEIEAEARSVPVLSWSSGGVRETRLRLGTPEEPLAFVRVGMDRNYAQRQIADIRWDVAVVLLVSLLVAFEILVFLIDRTIVSPLRLIDRTVARAFAGEWTVRPGRAPGRDEIGSVLGVIDRLSREIGDALLRIDRKLARLPSVPAALALKVEDLHRRVRLFVDEAGDAALESRSNARLPLFLFVFAEELSRSFLPLYAESVYRPIGEVPVLGPLAETLGLDGALGNEIVIGLPIMVFMAGVALATPFGGSWVSRYGSRTIFLAGAVPAFVGYLGTAFAITTYDMLFWRLLSAIGYATITIAAQGYLAQIGSGRARARNMAVFVAAVTTAVICGSAIGAVLADRFGYRATFVVSAGFVLLAALLAARYLKQHNEAGQPQRASARGQFRAFANPRFLALIVLAAIPAKIALTGFLFYTTPIFLASIELSQPTIGRMIMLYGILMLVGTQIGAWLHDRFGFGLGLVSLGGLATGLALLAPLAGDPETTMAIAIALFGLAQGLAAAPMLAILPALCPSETRAYGVTSLAGLLRLSERVGSVIGPLLAAVLAVRLGYVQAIAAIGLVSATTAVLFAVVSQRAAPGRLAEAEGGRDEGRP